MKYIYAVIWMLGMVAIVAFTFYHTWNQTTVEKYSDFLNWIGVAVVFFWYFLGKKWKVI